MTKTRLATLLLLFFWPAPVTSAVDSPVVTMSKITLQSGGRRIHIDKYTTLGNGRHPAILVLHGAGGTLADGPAMRRVAQHLAEAGNTIYLVHYFNRTGTIFGFDAGMQKNFPAWLETVRESIQFAQRESADRSPVGIYGYSLGGFLALAAASDNPAVGAVVEHAGGIWNGETEFIKRMPPVLIIHGERDARVPFQKYAQTLAGVLRKRSGNLKTRVFADEGHVFSAPAMSKVRAETVAFFRRHLGRN